MKSSDFLNKFKSWYLWKNLIAMAAVVVLLCLGVKFGLDLYTHHGESIPIPNLRHKQLADAEHILNSLGLELQVVDTGYVKSLPAINSPHSPTMTIPDVIDNCSLREAMAKLTAMGFHLETPQYIPGERDWVYGILVNGRHVVAGDKVSVEAALVIQVGNGMRSADDSIDYVDPAVEDTPEDKGDVDEFEVVSGPDAKEPAKGHSSSE